MNRFIIGFLIVVTATGCNNVHNVLNNKNDFAGKTFLLTKGTGVFQFGLGTWDFFIISSIGFRENGTGLITVEIYKSEKEIEFDWIFDEKRNWIKVTSINDKNTHLYFSYENNQLKSENISDEFYFDNIENLVLRNFTPKENWAAGHIKNNCVNLRLGPGTDYNKEKYPDIDKIDMYIVDKKGDWYQIAFPSENNLAVLFWVHKDYFVVTKKGTIVK